ncbi:MAG: PKD domain-containing protein [Sedimentisphaerales bacterium]|nr:PKD domain-containing protein [Sedimentisphaerales bacterium]
MLVCSACFAALFSASQAIAGTIPKTVPVTPPHKTNDLALAINWTVVATDIYGHAKAISNYNVYCSSDPLFVPDTATHANLLAVTDGTTFVHSNALATSTSLFYYVTAVGTDGTESLVFTDLVYKVSSEIACGPGTNAFAWLALPYDCPWTNAASLADQLQEVDKLYRFSETNQSYAVWDCLASTGSNFRIVPGEALGVEVSTGTVLHVYGRHSWTNAFAWEHRADRFNHHWLALPPNSVCADAESLAQAVPACTKVALYEPAQDRFQSWFLLDGTWRGTNFALIPGAGILVSIGSNSAWQPVLPYHTCSANADLPGGFVDLSVSLTGSVTLSAGTITSYQWDFDSDGAVDWTSPDTPGTTITYTNAGTFYPTLIAKNSYGFTAPGYRQVDALSFSIAPSQTVFNPYAGETNTIGFSISHTGVVDLAVVDATGGVVRSLVDAATLGAGDHQALWDGRDSTSNLVDDAGYFLMGVYTVNGHVYTQDWRAATGGLSIDATNANFTVTNVLNLAEGIYPEITFTLPSSCLVTITVRDSSGSIICTLVADGAFDAGTHTLTWNGTDNAGTLVAEGTYFYFDFEAETMGDGALIAQGKQPTISDFSVWPLRFTPAANPYADSTATSVTVLSFDLDRQADIALSVRDEAGTVVRSVNQLCAAGANNLAWDGTRDNERLVSQGQYVVTLTATSNGSTSEPSSAAVEVLY